MKIILTQDVYKLGSLGDEVNVKSGYGRNFLIPQNMAVPVTKANQKLIDHQRALLAEKRKTAIDEAKALATKLQAVELSFTVKAGESGKLFGSVTMKQIMAALHDAGIDLSKKVVQLGAPIKTLGTHSLTAKLHTEVSCDFSIKVEGDKEALAEAKAQAAAEAAEEAAAEAAKAPAKDAEATDAPEAAQEAGE